MFKTINKIAAFFRTKAKISKSALTSPIYKKVVFKDILYITKADSEEITNATKIITTNQTFFDSRTLKQFDEEFEFLVTISKNIVVNVLKIDAINGNNLAYVWCEKNKLNVSKRYKPILKQKIEQYL